MDVERYLADARALVVDEIRALTPPDSRWTGGLYALVLDYPLRGAKALRPALCIATARMLGAPLDAALPTAAALELYHNAFLVHDDVEDESLERRGRPSLPAEHGVPVSVNVGDAMLALAMRPLVDNAKDLGARRALGVLEVLAEMARRSAEGQALELGWIRRNEWALGRRDYVHMVWLKTAWYSFVAPMRCGLVVADAPALAVPLSRLGSMLGIAFQVQDDVLNLRETGRYGKEFAGDLWEGKRTLLLLHALRQAHGAERELALAILGKPRAHKDAAEVEWLVDFVDRHGGEAAAMETARAHAQRAARLFDGVLAATRPSVHRDFLGALIAYVTTRSW